MKNQFVHTLRVLGEYASKYGIEYNAETVKTDISWLLAVRSVNIHFRSDSPNLWSHTVSISLHLTVGENGNLHCEPEISWSSTGRNLAAAIAVIRLYQDAVEFASFAKCLIDATTAPTEAELGRVE